MAIAFALVGMVAGGAPAADNTPNAAPATLEGPVWRLIQLRGQDDATIAALPEAITIRLEAGRLQGFAGCNQLAGGYTVAGDRLTLGALAGTMMACPPPAMTVETAFKRALSGVLVFRIADGRLTLGAPADPAPQLVFLAAPPPRLDGTSWEVNGFNNGRQAVVSPLLGTTLSVSFADGAITGNAGCNSFRSTYTRDGARLTVGPIAATRKACDGTGVMEQERQFLAALESATTWAIERGMLDLHRPDGERVLLAHPASR
ncbi:MAG: META domain-containing protein [Candidatus Binatia bacterium]